MKKLSSTVTLLSHARLYGVAYKNHKLTHKKYVGIY